MAKRKKVPGSPPTGQAKRTKLSAEESLKRMEEFPERKEQFVAAVRRRAATLGSWNEFFGN
jgi:hypothetical protein